MAQEIVPWIIGANALLSIFTILVSLYSSGGAKFQKRLDEIALAVEKLEEDWDDKAEKRASDFRSEMRGIFTEIKESVALTSQRTGLTEKSLAVLESRMEQVPSRDMTHRLEVALTKLEGRIGTLAERIQPVAAVATRLQERAMAEKD